MHTSWLFAMRIRRYIGIFIRVRILDLTIHLSTGHERYIYIYTLNMSAKTICLSRPVTSLTTRIVQLIINIWYFSHSDGSWSLSRLTRLLSARKCPSMYYRCTITVCARIMSPWFIIDAVIPYFVLYIYSLRYF